MPFVLFLEMSKGLWEEGEGRRLRWQYMVAGLHIPRWNRTKKPLAIALSGAGRGLRGRDDGGGVSNAQYKFDWNCHYESPLVSWIYPNKNLF
jgi:hypothetical protein